jgi:4-diphosphocytidyl-2-C-methyl-D-erythritol kinase
VTVSENWPAPAKLNLFLHVVGRRADGYHLLQTVFQLIDYGDTLEFAPRADALIERHGDVPGVPQEQDLVVRAARLLQREGGVSRGATIHLKKRLPMGGGLGGGSSDAATTLLALNQLWGLDWPEQRLAELGLRLGADVPVFVYGRSSWGEGVGERLLPVTLAQPWYLVVVPPCQVPTKEIFSDPDLTRSAPLITIRRFLAGEGINAFEPIVRRRYPVVGEALDWLARFAPARMSGTGASIYAAFHDEATAQDVLAQVPHDWRGFVARGLNESPVLGRLREGAQARGAAGESR